LVSAGHAHWLLLPLLVAATLLLRVLACRRAAGHWKIAAFDGCRDALCGGLLFAALAPPLGLVAVMLPALLAEHSRAALAALGMLPLLAWIYGALPALACGALAGALKPWLPRWRGALACALVGTALAAGWFWAMDWSSTLRALWAPALSGALGGGLVGAWYLRHN
jgi:hypothetical protein